MNKGFVYKSKEFNFSKNVYYFVDVLLKDTDVDIKHSEGLEIKEITKSKIKFTCSNCDHFIELSDSLNSRVDISFRESLEINISKHTLDEKDEEIRLYSNKPLNNAIIEVLRGGKKVNISPTKEEDYISLNIDTVAKLSYQVKVKIGDYIKTFDLINNLKEEKISPYRVYSEYKKGKTFLTVESKQCVEKDFDLIIKGDVEKDVIWKKNKQSITFSHIIEVEDYKKLKLNINGYTHHIYVVNRNNFPSGIYKTNNGIKFNKPVLNEIILKTNKEEYIIKPNNQELFMTDIPRTEFRGYFKDILLFKQNISREKKLPKIIMLNNPLRFKSDTISKKDINIGLVGHTTKWKIKAGSSEIILREVKLKKGINKFSIDYVDNAYVDKTDWYYTSI